MLVRSSIMGDEEKEEEDWHVGCVVVVVVGGRGVDSIRRDGSSRKR